MKVAVIAEDGNVLTIREINLGGLNYTPSDEEFFALAKKEVLEDGLVSAEEAARLTFKRAE